MAATKSAAIRLPEVTKESCDEAETWFKCNRDQLPKGVVDLLGFGLETARHGSNPEVKTRRLLVELRRALGITDSSERRKSGSPLSGLPKDKRQARLDELERCRHDQKYLDNLAVWHKNLAKQKIRESRELTKRIIKLEQEDEEDKVLSPEEQKAWEAAECAAYRQRFTQGERCDLDAAKPSEAVMQGATTAAELEFVDCLVDRDGLPKDSKITGQFFEDRSRISFSFNVTELELNVEKLSVRTKNGTTLIAASTEDIGPPKTKVTWEFLANMAILVSQYAIPLNRFAGLVSTDVKRFSSAEVCRHFQYVASRLCPIYLDFPRSLARADILNGDDTTGRVLQIRKAFKARETDPSVAMPWHHYANQEIASKALASATNPSLAVRLAAQLGFVSERKDRTGNKHGFYTTHIAGRSEAFDVRSTIIFYRSHFGSFGNLLETILKDRPLDAGQLIVQSDLATVNLIGDEDLRKRLNILQIGCASHARRPFALHENDDPQLCDAILHEFKGIFICEHGLDAFGRNRDNSRAGRGHDAKDCWESIRRYATVLAERWAATTPLGEAARYILNHYKKLTYYLSDHRLTPSNNFSERMLRMEKWIEDAALFRQTLEGRFALDIVRSVLQTAIAARVDLQSYLNWVLRMPEDVVSRYPQEFTPLAFARLTQ